MKLVIEPESLELEVSPPETILESSLRSGVPHTHVCGGKARCSTCRVLVLEGIESCPPRNASEQVLASRLEFDDSIRLACQTPAGDLRVRRLVLDRRDARITSQLSRKNQSAVAGVEREIAILFSDIRGFTTLSEKLYPYDIIHLLNRYFDRMVSIIEGNEGRVDNLIGDGIMAVFCVGEPARQAAQSVAAGQQMIAAARDFAAYVKTAYSLPSFRIGVGIHLGLAVIGSLGSGQSQRQTVIGDSVNLASRVESATKTFQVDFLISEEVRGMLTEEVPIGRQFETEVKGKSGRFRLFEVLPEVLPEGGSGPPDPDG